LEDVMRHLRRTCAGLLLVLALSAAAFAGETQFPGADGQMETPRAAGDMQFPGATGDIPNPSVAGDISTPGVMGDILLPGIRLLLSTLL
jgi:hypothetical protein